MSAVHGELKTDIRSRDGRSRYHDESEILLLGEQLLPVRVNSDGYYKCKWCNCVGIKKAKLEGWMTYSGTYISKPFVVNIPKNIENADICCQAIFFDDKLYVLNTKTHQFTNVNILSGAKSKTVELFSAANASYASENIKIPPKQLRYNGRAFIIWKSFLFELEWCYDNSALITRQHLKWISSFDRIFVCGNYGMALTMSAHPIWHNKTIKNWVDERNDYLICYEPNQQIIYRLTQNDVKLKEFHERKGVFAPKALISSLSWSNETQSIAVCIGDYVYTINHKLLQNMKCRECKDCFDEKEYTHDSSFGEWEPQFDDDAESDSDGVDDITTFMSKGMGWYVNNNVGFNKMKSGQPETGGRQQPISKSRAEHLYSCYHPSTNYRIIAGLNIEKQIHYNKLKCLQSKKYKKLNQFGDLADYLGSVIWYQYSGAHQSNIHVIKVATLVDFKHGLRSSNQITIINLELGMHSISSLVPGRCGWIGIIDSDHPHNKWNKRKVNVPSLIYTGLYSNHFEVTKGRIICTDMYDHNPQFGNAMKGKWYWKSNRNEVEQQLLAYHESVQYDKEYTDCWDVPSHDQLFDDHEEFEMEQFESVENENQDLPLDLIKISEREFCNLLELLHSIELVENVLDELVIQEICEFCYFVSSLNWIKKAVLNGKWYLHRQIVTCDHEFRAGIFDYDHFRDDKVIEDPYSGKKGYEWFHFEEKNGNEMQTNLWEEAVKQSLQRRDPCSVTYGCVTSLGLEDEYGCSSRCSCLAKLDTVTKQVVCVRLVFNHR